MNKTFTFTSCRSILRRLAVVIAMPTVAVLVVLPLGCASTQTMDSMDSAASVPASEGTVKTKEGANGNTNVSVRVKHLAPASRVAPNARVYVVWIQPRDAERQNVGAMALDSDLEGHLETVTPHRDFLLTVTPEQHGRVDQPTNSPVFTSNVNRGN